MNGTILSLVSGAITLIVLIWKYFSRKSRSQREQRDAACKIIREGLAENDASKVTAGFDRLNRCS
jgi:hypothetical protein